MLSPELIAVHAVAADWREAITLAGDLLVGAGRSTREYTHEMIRAVEDLGPYIVIAPGLALAHARPSENVRQAGLSLVTLATPVVFGDPVNDPVDIVVGLCAPDSQAHIEHLSRFATFLGEPDSLDALRGARTVDEVVAVFDRYERRSLL